VTVEQQIFSPLGAVTGHDWRFDDAYFGDRSRDLMVFRGLLDNIGDELERANVAYGDAPACLFERNLH
jgi:hypothetical protein